MSRGGGSFGKRAKPAVKIRTEEEEAKENPLLLQNKLTSEKPPETYPPLENPAKRIHLSTHEKDVVERGRVLSEFFRYSGYHLKRPAPEKNQSVHLERYSDRYRKIQGKRELADEIPFPSAHIYPRELLLGTRHRFSAKSQFESKVLYRSSQALNKAAQRLVTGVGGSGDEDMGDVAERDTDDVQKTLEEALRLERAGLGGGAGRGEQGEDEDKEEEDEEALEEAEEEEDEMGGGDYTANYGDDDEDGDDAYGDDGDGDTFG